MILWTDKLAALETSSLLDRLDREGYQADSKARTKLHDFSRYWRTDSISFHEWPDRSDSPS